MAECCNRYPSVEVEYQILNKPEEIIAGEQIGLKISVERDIEEDEYQELV